MSRDRPSCRRLAAAGAVLLALAGGCRSKPSPESLKPLANLLPGKPLPAEDVTDVAGCAFQSGTFTLTGACKATIQKSGKMMRRGKLKLASGIKVLVSFKPADGETIDVTLDTDNRTIDLPIRKEGGTLSLGCVPEALGRPCAVALAAPG